MMDATPALVAQSEDLLRITSAGADERADVLAAAKAVLAAVDADLEARFLEGMPALKAMAERSNAMDTVIKALLGHAAEKVFPAANPTTGERFAVIAVGGYGRGNLAPYSDIDLLFLTPYKRASRVEQMVEHMLYLLWDLGLKVGHATRSIEECVRLAKSDLGRGSFG
jgi:[protein-PII] uridylyltransferase